MRVRNFLLVLGVLTVLLGAGLGVVWYRQPSTPTPKAAVVVPKVAILVARRDLPIGTLLRLEDMDFRDIPQPDLVPSDMPRGQATPADLVGAVTRRGFQAQEELVAADLVKPGERDFLVATLAPGFRAVSISTDVTQSASGLMLPGDRVDVLLTQNFSVPTGGDPGLRSVGETVLHDLRIIAVDQVLTDAVPPGEVAGNLHPEPRVPKTITLEVSERQAEMLMVANQLGKVQLALRGQRGGIPGLTAADTVAPAWASDVSPALQRLGAPPPAPPPAAAAEAPPSPDVSAKKAASIEVIHGSKTERLCFSDTGTVACP